MQRRPVLHPFDILLRTLLVLAVLCGFACAKPRPPEAPAPTVDAAPATPQAETNAGDEDDEAPAPWTKPFLWRIEGKKPSYLFGTIHVPDARLAPAPASVVAAFNDADVLNTEVPMDKAAQLAIMPRVLLPGKKTLNDLLPAETCARIESALGQRQLRWEPFSHMKPWVIATQLTLLDRLALIAQRPSLDSGLYQEAQDAKKEVGGLETADEQFAAMDGLTKEEQAFLVNDALDSLDEQKKSGVDPVAVLLDAYVAGDESVAIRLLEKRAERPDKNAVAVRIHKRLVVDRNVVMAARIAKRLQSGKSHLFAVGLAHLLGSDSLVALLGKRGLKVVRVDVADVAAPEPPVRIQPTPRAQP